jgi:FKBP-type peptidyl-prolyl cis-trans isomerase
MREILLTIIVVTLVATNCQNKPDNRSRPPARTEAELIELNRERISQDRNEIQGYLDSTGQKFTETATGLWYSVVKDGAGENPGSGDRVSFDYVCTLLNGELCYSGKETVTVGYSDVPSGITEGLTMMQVGSDFIFIVPPYLAYGLTGDGEKIPGRAILIYRLRVNTIE